MTALDPGDPTRAARVELARAHLAAGRPLTLRAEGHSMWPLVKGGDLVVVHPIRAPLVVGDVVLVVLGGRLVLHRVIALTDGGCVTKGDAVPARDPPIPHAHILGVRPRVHPRLGRLVAALSTHAPRPLAAALRRVRLAVATLPV